MDFERSITNGEIRAILRRLGISEPTEDSVGFGIGLIQVASRRLGHPITWEDAESLSQDESDRIMQAASTLGAGGLEERSQAVRELLDSIPATTGVDPT